MHLLDSRLRGNDGAGVVFSAFLWRTAHLVQYLSRLLTSGEKRVIPAQAGIQYQVCELLAGGNIGVPCDFG